MSNESFYEGGTIPWVTPKDMKRWEITEAKMFITSEAVEKSAAKMIPTNSVLVTLRSGVLKHTLPVAVTRKPVALNQDLKAFTCGPSLNPDFLARFLKSAEETVLGWVRGTTADNVPLPKLLDLAVPVPPLPEQKRIAAILDKADEIRRKRVETIKLTEELLKSAFLEMFGDPVTNPKGWEVRKLGEVATRVTKGESPGWQGFEYQQNGVRFVTSENVLWGKLSLKKQKFISPEFDEKLSRSRLTAGDVLLNLVGASIGRTAIVGNDALPANTNQAVAVVSLDRAHLLPEIVLHQLLHPSMQRQLLGSAVEVARANISLTNIRDLEVIAPPMERQNAWRKVVRKLQYIQFNLENAASLITQNASSLTQRAFSGGL